MLGLKALTWILPHGEADKPTRRMYAATDTYMYVCVYDSTSNSYEYWRSPVMSLRGDGTQEWEGDIPWERIDTR